MSVKGHAERKRRWYWKTRSRRIFETGTVTNGARSKRWLPIEGYYKENESRRDYYYRGIIKLGEYRKDWTGLVWRVPTKNIEESLSKDFLPDSFENPLSNPYQFAEFYPSFSDSYKTIEYEMDMLLNSCYWFYPSEPEGKDLAFKLRSWNHKYMTLLDRRSKKQTNLNPLSLQS